MLSSLVSTWPPLILSVSNDIFKSVLVQLNSWLESFRFCKAELNGFFFFVLIFISASTSWAWSWNGLRTMVVQQPWRSLAPSSHKWFMILSIILKDSMCKLMDLFFHILPLVNSKRCLCLVLLKGKWMHSPFSETPKCWLAGWSCIPTPEFPALGLCPSGWWHFEY